MHDLFNYINAVLVIIYIILLLIKHGKKMKNKENVMFACFELFFALRRTFLLPRYGRWIHIGLMIIWYALGIYHVYNAIKGFKNKED